MLKLDYVFDNLLESLEAAESLARASIRQAETFMQNIERKAKDRKVIRYPTHELTKAVNYYFQVERSMDRLEIVLGTIAEFGENISRNQKDKLILKIRNIIRRIKTCDVQFSQESNIVAELEILIFKLDLDKR